MSVLAGTDASARPTHPGPARAAAHAASATHRGAAAVYVVALLLVYFQTNVVERMAARLLPLAVLGVLLSCRRRDVLTRIAPLSLSGFLVWAAASYLWSADRSGSAIVLLGLFSSAVVAWCCGSFLSLTDLHRLTTLVAKALCLLTAAFLVLAHGLSTRPAEDGAPGWHGPFSHKNGLGAFVVVALLCFWFDRSIPRARRAAWLALGGVLLIGSQSSTALALVLLAGAALLWQHQTGSGQPLWRRVAYLAALGTALALLVAALATSFSVVTGLFGRKGDLSGRTTIWHVVVERIARRPFEGWGYGGMWRPASLPSQQMWQEMRFHAYHSHSGYLDLLLQVGVVGLVLYLGFVLGAMRRHWRARAQPLHLWAALLMLTICCNAVTESAPFFSDGLLFLVGLAVVRDTAPASRWTPPSSAGRRPDAHARKADPGG